MNKDLFIKWVKEVNDKIIVKHTTYNRRYEKHGLINKLLRKLNIGGYGNDLMDKYTVTAFVGVGDNIGRVEKVFDLFVYLYTDIESQEAYVKKTIKEMIQDYKVYRKPPNNYL
jgi:hypothetical protein